MRKSWSAVAVTIPFGTAAQAAGPAPLIADPAAYVNPFIGSTNLGNTYPGAVRPFGMLAWSPQTSKGKQISTPAPGGYQYTATRIRGCGPLTAIFPSRGRTRSTPANRTSRMRLNQRPA